MLSRPFPLPSHLHLFSASATRLPCYLPVNLVPFHLGIGQKSSAASANFASSSTTRSALPLLLSLHPFYVWGKPETYLRKGSQNIFLTYFYSQHNDGGTGEPIMVIVKYALLRFTKHLASTIVAENNYSTTLIDGSRANDSQFIKEETEA